MIKLIEKIKKQVVDSVINYSPEAVQQMNVGDEILELFWQYDISGVDPNIFQDQIEAKLRASVPFLPKEVDALDLGMKKPFIIHKKEDAKVWGLAELEARSRELAEATHFPRIAQYVIDNGKIEKQARAGFGDNRAIVNKGGWPTKIGK